MPIETQLVGEMRNQPLVSNSCSLEAFKRNHITTILKAFYGEIIGNRGASEILSLPTSTLGGNAKVAVK